MALKPPRTQRARTVGHISRDARVRVDQRVKEILARREAAVERALSTSKAQASTAPDSAPPERSQLPASAAREPVHVA
jgi:hypothetical protein